MIIHHVVTIGLVFLSYISNFTRAGATILFLHDVSDVILEFSKCLFYIGSAGKSAYRKMFKKLCDVLFGLFAATFAYTRLYHLPWRGVYACYEYSREFHGFAYLSMWSLLVILQCLHFFWFYLILRMIYKLVKTGEVEKDERSDDDTFPEDAKATEESPVIQLKAVKTKTKIKADTKKD